MAPGGNRRATVTAVVASGTAELRPDPAYPRAWTLLVNGVPQSYVDLDDPAHLEFDYLVRMATVVRLCAPPRVPLAVLHLGGGGLALARLVGHLRPGSAQRVVERDGELAALVSRLLPPPAAVTIDVGDARERLERTGPGRYDLILADVFDGARMPGSVATAGFAAAAARVLRPDGRLAMNVTDVPPMAYTRVQVATLRSVFADVCLLADPAVLRARKAGNAVLVAGADLGDLPARAGALRGAALNAFSKGARARLDAPG
jgi:spermidine synthase